MRINFFRKKSHGIYTFSGAAGGGFFAGKMGRALVIVGGILVLGLILLWIFYPRADKYFWSASAPLDKVDLSLSPLEAPVWTQLDLKVDLNFTPEITGGKNVAGARGNASKDSAVNQTETSLNMPELDDNLPALTADDFYQN